jgi:ribose transport system substrate-binding protein
MRRSLRGALLVGVLVLVASVSTSAFGASATHARVGTAHAGKLKIALSNSFIGNQWRIEMENLFKAGCNMPPYKTEVTCTVFNSGNDVGKQTQQISDLISEHVDAIVVDAASPTGLNGVIQQACARGIVVVSFDNTASAPCGQQVSVSQSQVGQVLAKFIVAQLHGKGNVIMVTGVAGTQADTDRNAAAKAVFAASPGIKLVRTYTGMWDSATAQRNTAAQLASLPTINGAWVSGGTDGVLKAFVAAGKKLPVTGGEGENGFRKFMLGYQGAKVDGASSGTPPFLSLAALELAREIVTKQHAKANITLPAPYVTTATVKSGTTVFPALPDSFYATFTDSGPKATVQICVAAALTGKPCPGTLKVSLP